jgi:hypothetical protein
MLLLAAEPALVNHHKPCNRLGSFGTHISFDHCQN